MKNKIFLLVIILIGLSSTILSQTSFRSAIFLHRSVGGNIYGPNGSNTSVPEECELYNIAHNYSGNDTVYIYDEVFPPISTDNEWYRWHHIFDNDLGYQSYSTTFYSYINDPNYDIIIIKTCYPAANIFYVGVPSDTLTEYEERNLEVYKWHIRSFLDIMKQYPDKFFVIWTLAPYTESMTEPLFASYADWFSTWMKDTLATGLDATYGAFPPNVYVFDYFNKIADENGYMPLQYAIASNDPHPNAAATELIAPQFVHEIFDAAIYYESTIPVELLSFSASIIPIGVELYWSTATELNNDGFEIQRITDSGDFIPIGFVKGQGTSTQKKDYNFIDKNTTSGRYIYRLKQIDFNGNYKYSNQLEVDFSAITTYSLEQNYPNPFNPSTEINFTLANSGNITLKVYDSLGLEVAILVDGYLKAGKHSVMFNAKNFTSGVYYYRIKSDNFTSTRKMIVIK